MILRIGGTLLITRISMFVFVGIALGLAYFLPREHYFYIPLKDLLSILVVVWLAIIYGKTNSEKECKRRIVERFIGEILTIIETKDLSNINNEEKYYVVTHYQRTIKNLFSLLKKHEKTFEYTEVLEYCTDEFSKFWDNVSENNHNYNILLSYECNYRSYLSNVSNKLKAILSDLYK